MECKFWLSPSLKQCQNPFSGSSRLYQDLSMRHYWLVKKTMVNLPVSLKGNLKCISGNLLSPLGPRTKILVLLPRCYYPRLDYSTFAVQATCRYLRASAVRKTLLYVWLPLLYNHHVLVVAAQLFFPKKSAFFYLKHAKPENLTTLVQVVVFTVQCTCIIMAWS